jgi:hypothetical protein
MAAAPTRDVRSLIFLASLGPVAAATAAAFFGVAFLWLALPNPAGAPADVDPPARIVRVDQFPLPEGNDTSGATATDADNLAAMSMPDPMPSSAATIGEAPTYQEVTAVTPRALQARPGLIPPAEVTRAKRARIIRYHRQITKRYAAGLWRPDARAGPNPGGGFYGPPNINVGYINPR